MKDDIVFVVTLILGAIVFVYAVISLTLGWVAVGKEADWCAYKDGNPYSKDAEPTGDRWVIHPLTLGLTGECVDGRND